MKKYYAYTVLVLSFCLIFSGCAVIFQTGRRSDMEKIKSLEKELEELRNAKGSLEQRLSSEIQVDQVRVKMEDKGLVITFVAEVLFDSGKAVLRPESLASLDKVADFIIEEVPQNPIGIEGHTDNEPIKRSSWKSNWELSSHRALSVFGYLETKGVSSERLSASGYGEYRPVAGNDTKEGRRTNRRVEIVIMPKTIKKVEKNALHAAEAAGSSEEDVQEEDLK
jgi:chemotaxis protein MotB